MSPARPRNFRDLVLFATGSLRRRPDWRDYAMADMRAVKDVSAVLGVPPPSHYLSPDVKGIYSQGALPACVSYAAAAMQSIFEQQERGKWFTFDANECYVQNGGSGSAGVSTRDVLEWMQDTGLRVQGTKQRYRIGSYAFVDVGPYSPEGVGVLKAAIAAGHPPVLALRLPKDFRTAPMGQSKGGAVSAEYHQVCLTGYTPERFEFVNSWGSQYGDKGFGTIPWDFLLKDEQADLAYAFTATDAIDEDLPP